MTNPIGSSGSPTGGFFSNNEANMMPSGPSLPANNPWVQSLAKLFPNVPIGELQLYAAKFQQNMFSALNNEIQRDLKKAREAAKKFKDSINE